MSVDNPSHLSVTDRLTQLGACDEAKAWVRRQRQSPETLWNRCPRGDWLLWLARQAGVPPRTLVAVAVEIAESVLHLVPQDETRPGEALRVTRAWLAGEATLDQVRTASYAASASAAASYAAYTTSAAYAAYAAYAAASASAFAAAYAAAEVAAFAAADVASYAASASAFAAASASASAARRAQERKYADIVRKHVPFHQVAKFLQTGS